MPGGDVLIHAGDVTRHGVEDEVIDFLNWFEKQPFEYRIFVAGNYDFYFERTAEDKLEKIIPEGVIYLKDSGFSINGINIWGSPVTPWFFDWAFNRHRGPAIRWHWDLIPPGTDVLVTHGPVYGIHDCTIDGIHVGCYDLLQRVIEIKPLIHVGGHIHEGYGTAKINNTIFVNASVLDEGYRLVNKPVVLDI